MKSKHCSQCGKDIKVEKIEEFHFDTVGLPNVWLINVEGYTCAHCGNKSVLIPSFGQLMSTIAEALVFKNAGYISSEISFLKKFFGLKNKQIAKKLGTSEKTVSFWVKGNSRVSPAYGVKLRKFFSEEFCQHLKNKEERHKDILARVKAFIKDLQKKDSEKDFLKGLKEKALGAAKAKVSDAEMFASDGCEELMFRIPNSSISVQLRN